MHNPLPTPKSPFFTHKKKKRKGKKKVKSNIQCSLLHQLAVECNGALESERDCSSILELLLLPGNQFNASYSLFSESSHSTFSFFSFLHEPTWWVGGDNGSCRQTVATNSIPLSLLVSMVIPWTEMSKISLEKGYCKNLSTKGYCESSLMDLSKILTYKIL